MPIAANASNDVHDILSRILERFGNMRQNRGGRPKRDVEALRSDEKPGSKRKRSIDKPARMEIHGQVQADVTNIVLQMSKDFDNSAKGRTAFWKAAKPIMGDIPRKRLKKMMKT